MLFFSVIFLFFVPLAFLAIDPNDPCFYGTDYCLNPDGSTDCTSDLVARVRFIAAHNDETDTEYLLVSLLGNYSKRPEHVNLSLGINVKGEPYNFYCSSDGKETYKLSGYYRLVSSYEYICDWKLIVTANGNQVAPVTNSSISIDLATIDDNVPILLGYNGMESIVAPNLKGTLFHQLSHLECRIENRMSFYDDEKKNRITIVKKVYNTEMEIFIQRLIPDEKSTDRTIKFVNANGVSLTVSCDESFGILSGNVQEGERKESIENYFNFKLLDGYRCGLRLPLLMQTNNIKFDFDARPLDFSFTSTSGSSVSKQDIKFDTDPRNDPDKTDLPDQSDQPSQSEIDWESFDNNGD